MNEYTSPEDRIRLAEFCGIKNFGKYLGQRWFDPLNDHNDCHALIEALHRDGKIVRREDGPEFVNTEVRIWHFGMAGKPRIWTGNEDYRTGVVTLALEILNTQTKESDT